MSADGPLQRRAHALLQVPSWFTPAIAADWLIAVVLMTVNKVFIENSLPFQQPLEAFIGDPTLQYKHVVDQHVSGVANTWLTLGMPLGVVLLVSGVRNSLFEAHHGALALFAGYELNEIATNFIKQRVGRLRPDFFDRCQYDAASHLCTGPFAVVQEGRRSFPSGHSSSAFFGCVFLILFLAGKNRCFAFSTSYTQSGILHSRLLRVMLAILPLFLSFYIAISRWEDHWHHPTDIIAGSTLGTLIALLIYHIWWPSPFTSANFDTMGVPRKSHADNDVNAETQDLLNDADQV